MSEPSFFCERETMKIWRCELVGLPNKVEWYELKRDARERLKEWRRAGGDPNSYMWLVDFPDTRREMVKWLTDNVAK